MDKTKKKPAVNRLLPVFYWMSLCGIPFVMLPVVYFACAVSITGGEGFTGHDPNLSRMLVLFAENLLGGILCALLTLLGGKIRDKDPDNAKLTLTANILMAVGIILELIAHTLLNFALTAEFFITAIALIVTYILVWKKAYHSYGSIVDKGILAAYCIIAAIVVVFFWGMKVQYSRMAMVWGLFYLAICYALTQNQSNIDFMMARRKHKMEHLPGVVRQRSLLLTLGVLAAVLVCILLTPQITRLFGQCLNAIKVILLGILRFLWSLIPESEPSEEVEEAAAGGPGDMGGMGAAEDGSPLWDYILWPLIILGAIWLIYTYRDSIMRWWITLWRTLRTKIRGALFSAPKRARITGGGEGDYEDEVVELSAMEVKEELRKDVFKPRQWKRDLKAWRTMENGEEKYRRGYQLALSWLSWRKVPLLPSDTPLEVLEKAKKVLSEAEWAAVTDWYNQIRYGEPETFPAQAMQPLTRALEYMEKAK